MSTTINGQKVPDHFRSIDHLPELIAALENDWSAWPDGDYKESDLDWLHQFHSLCGEKHTINSVDIEAATIHGPRIFNKLGERQKADLIAYFSSVFPNYSSEPSQDYTLPSSGFQFHRDLVVVERAPDPKNERHEVSIDVLSTYFVENIWPASQQDFYFAKLEPLIRQKANEDQRSIFKELNKLDATVAAGQLANDVTAVLRDHGIMHAILVRQDESGQLHYGLLNR